MRTGRRFTKNHAYEQKIHTIQENSCVRGEDSQKRAGDSHKSCIRAVELPKSCARTQNSCVQAERLQTLKNSHVSDAIIQPVVEDPMHDDRILVEAGTEPITIPCALSESEKMKHELTHIPFKPWCTSSVKGKAQSEPHKRIERITERQRTFHCSVRLSGFERHCSVRRTESFEHVCEIVWVRHIHSC